MDALKELFAQLIEKIKTLTEAILSRFKPLSDDPGTPVPTDPGSSTGDPLKPRDAMDPRSVLGIGLDKPDGSANPVGLFRGDPKHPRYRPGDGRKIMMVRDALIDGKKWDFYITSSGEVWDLEVPPDHPSIGFKIPRD